MQREIFLAEQTLKTIFVFPGLSLFSCATNLRGFDVAHALEIKMQGEKSRGCKAFLVQKVVEIP